MSGFLIPTLNTLKSLPISSLQQGLAFIVLEKYAWYIYDVNSIELIDNDNVVAADNGNGKWIKCNNNTNINNTIFGISTIGSPTILNLSLYDNYYVNLTQNTQLTFSNISSGIFKVLIKNNGFNITSWDTRVRWSGSVFVPNLAKQLAILEFVIYNTDIYCTSISEY